MLRANTRKQILQVLDETSFSSANFAVSYSDTNPDVLVKIAFLPNKNFEFSLSSANEIEWITAECPGEKLLKVEYFRRRSFDASLFAIKDWVERIYEEYVHENPLFDEFSDLREALEQHISEHNAGPNKFFTRAEGEELKRKLDELAAKLRNAGEHAGSTPQEIDIALQDIEVLKNDTEILPQSAWYRKAGNKILSVVKGAVKTTEGREFLLEAAKKFLLEGPKV